MFRFFMTLMNLKLKELGGPGLSVLLRNALKEALIKHCAHTLVVNDTIRDWYKKAYPEISLTAVKNVPNLPSVVGRSKMRSELDISEKHCVVTYCGLLGRGRGLEPLIDAFKELGGDYQLVLIGEGSIKSHLKSLTSKHINIHFVDQMPQSELISFLTGQI